MSNNDGWEDVATGPPAKASSTDDGWEDIAVGPPSSQDAVLAAQANAQPEGQPWYIPNTGRSFTDDIKAAPSDLYEGLSQLNGQVVRGLTGRQGFKPAALLRSALNGTSYDDEFNKLISSNDQFASTDPIAAAGARFVGGAIPTLALPEVQAIKNAPALLQSAGRVMQGGVIGAGLGGMQDLLEEQDPTQGIDTGSKAGLLLALGGEALRVPLAGYRTLRSIGASSGRANIAANMVQDVSQDSGLLPKLSASLDSGDPLISVMSPGEITQNPNLGVLEKNIQKTESLNTAAAFSARAQERSGLRQALLATGLPDGDAGLATEVLKGKQNALDSAVTSGVNNLGDELSPESVGAQVLPELKAARDASYQSVKDAYNAADLTGAKIPVAKELNGVDDLLTAQGYGAQYPPHPAVNQYISDIEDAAALGRGTIGANALESLRSKGGKISGNLYGNDNQAAGAIRAIRSHVIDGALDRATTGNQLANNFTPEQLATLKTARQLRTEHGALYEEGTIGKILDRNQYGRDTFEPSKVLGRATSTPEALDQLTHAVGPDSPAVDAIKQGLVGNLKQSVDQEGFIPGGKLQSFLSQHRDTIDRFPDIKAQVEALKDNAIPDALAHKKAFSDFYGKDPEHAARLAINGGNPAERVRGIMAELSSDPEAAQGFKRGVFDAITGDPAKLTANGLAKAFTRHKNVIAELYSPAELEGSQKVLADLESEANYHRSADLASKGNSVTAQGQTTAQAIEQQVRDRLGVITKVTNHPAVGAILGFLGGGKVGAGAGVVASRFIDGQVEKAVIGVKAHLAQMALDPEYARTLLQKASAANLNKVGPSILGRSFYSLFPEISRQTGSPPKQDVLPAKSNPALLRDTLNGNSNGGNASSVPARIPAPVRRLDNASGSVPVKRNSGASSGRLDPTTLSPAAQEIYNHPFVSAILGAEGAKGNPRVTSSKNAKGLMQVLDSTGRQEFKELGLDGEYDPFNPAQNLMVGAHYLGKLEDRYNSRPLAAAAYNAGMGRVDTAISKAGTNDWKVVQRFLPKKVQKETIPYVSRVTKALGGDNG